MFVYCIFFPVFEDIERSCTKSLFILPLKYCFQAISWTDVGLVKRIRGVSFSTRVSAQFENTMIHAARGILNPLLADVHIFTDHKAGAQAGKYV